MMYKNIGENKCVQLIFLLGKRNNTNHSPRLIPTRSLQKSRKQVKTLSHILEDGMLI